MGKIGEFADRHADGVVAFMVIIFLIGLVTTAALSRGGVDENENQNENENVDCDLNDNENVDDNDNDSDGAEDDGDFVIAAGETIPSLDSLTDMLFMEDAP